MDKFIGIAAVSALVISLASSSCQNSSQECMKEQITVSVRTDTDLNDLSLYIYPLGVETEDDSPMAALEDRVLIQTIPTAPTGLYEMVCVRGTAQYQLPLFIDGTQDSVLLSVILSDECPSAQMICTGSDKDAERKAKRANASLDALNSFNSLYYRLSREVWTNAAGMSDSDIRSMISEYSKQADKAASDKSVSTDVKEYIRIWAYLQSVESANVYNRMNSSSLPLFNDGGNAGNALLDAPYTVLDSPAASLHQSALNTAVQAIPKGSLESKLEYIASHYSDGTMVNGMQRSVLNSFIRSYNFSAGVQNGLDALTAAQEKYGIDQSYLESFKDRCSAIPGSPFPDVELIDTDGNPVSISQFKGRYVYIDLWASWCGPCCKEVPYLQALEKEFRGSDDIVFVSISTDSGEQPWREKMEQLDMHGNQWLNADGKLCDRLNVSGIPHFLIYDREGLLHTYDAPRPSSGSALRSILESLE
ncbi:MAG: TlpA family protein disulfide reductase [Bacteroidaceae bacterium]|nr:TlpA family protein disulfide reductase [Bacteroidaceae bacterium]